MNARSAAGDFNGIRRKTALSDRRNRPRWWRCGAGFLHVVVNEVRLDGFQRFGRGSFDPRSKP